MNRIMKLSNLKILLAEHDPFIADAFQIFFLSRRCVLVVVESAEKGIHLLEKENFDVIASEFELLGKKGIGFFKRVNSLNPEAVKILITNYRDLNRVPEALGSVVDDIIEKPFPFGEFLEIISRHISIQSEQSKIVSLVAQAG